MLAINTHNGMFATNRLPFGVTSAPGICHRIMNTVLKGLKGVACYLDDISVTGKSKRGHIMNLKVVLKRLAERTVRVKADKCILF